MADTFGDNVRRMVLAEVIHHRWRTCSGEDLSRLLDASAVRWHKVRMRFIWFLLVIGGLLGLLYSVGLTLFPMRPEEVESQAAKWLSYAGFSEWGEGLTKSTDFWVSTALSILLVVAIGLVCVVLIRMFRREAVAVKRNPGNGWRISRLIMRASTLRGVEALCQDFLAQPHRTDEIRVLAARAIRQHRAKGGTERHSWEFWLGLEPAMQKHGEEAVTQAITALDEEFPSSWWRKRRMNHAAALEARMLRLERQRETESPPSPDPDASATGEFTSDGKEAAKLLLRASDLDEVQQLYTQYKRAAHPEGRLFERFVHKAYIYRLDKAGERDKANEYYDVVESQDKDSVGEDIEFALLVDEAKKDARHDERG